MNYSENKGTSQTNLVIYWVDLFYQCLFLVQLSKEFHCFYISSSSSSSTNNNNDDETMISNQSEGTLDRDI